tara:strand:- start:215 stop:889 length:675 start_codon:yes stop_codon:yes gene_type:complete
VNKKLIITFLSLIVFITLLINHNNILTYIFIKNFSKWTEHRTNLESLNINFWKQTIKINKIEIRNKEGFFNKNVFEAESIFIEYDYKSILSNEVIIKKLIINQPNFYFEIKADKKIVDNLNLSKKTLKGYSPKIYPNKNNDKNFIIIELYIKNSKAHIYYSKNNSNLNLNLSDMTFGKVGNLNNESDKKTQHYKNVLELILKDIFMRIPDQDLKDLIRKTYKFN